jgi:hypothetical protein
MAMTVLVHARALPAYFCGFDDFTNARRAALEDAANPASMFTSTHFGSSKYRPLSRAATYAAETSGWPPALGHRIRNLAGHLISVCAVFAIAQLLGAPSGRAAVAATLFGVSPMSHQTVAAAIFTIDLAYAAMLWSLAAFMIAYDRVHAATRWLVAALALALAGLFTYEATIAVFGSMACYVIVRERAGNPPASGRARFFGRFAVGAAAVLLIFVGVRHAFVTGRMPLTPLPTILVNGALFAGALASPVDLLSLSWVAGTPLPSELVRDHAVALAGSFTGAAVTVLLVTGSRRARAWITQVPWAVVAWLAISIALTLAPFLLFSDHPSETYLYAPAAFFAVAWTMVASALLPPRAFHGVAGMLVLVAAVSSALRTERVRACAETAARIVTSLPLDDWRHGAPRVHLADAPGLPPMRRFGLYGYHGLGTIDPREEHWNALEAALQLATANRELRAAVVPTDGLLATCARVDFCGWVSGDGTVRAVPR